MHCWKCGEAIEVKDKVHRKDVCPKCDVDLRCCYNCNFYDKEANHQCKEPQAEWVRYKEKGNFCDYFRPKPAFIRKEQKLDPKETRKQNWDSLFKGDSEEN
ncbi:MAG: hypothetical protein WBF13_07405 [Candidatus Zixiibacteriota bacterium]